MLGASPVSCRRSTNLEKQSGAGDCIWTCCATTRDHGLSHKPHVPTLHLFHHLQSHTMICSNPEPRLVSRRSPRQRKPGSRRRACRMQTYDDDDYSSAHMCPLASADPPVIPIRFQNLCFLTENVLLHCRIYVSKPCRDLTEHYPDRGDFRFHEAR